MSRLREKISEFASIYAREFRIIGSDIGLILFFVFLPLIYPIIYSLIYNTEVVRDVALVVVDHDRTPLSRELVRELDATEGTNVIGYAADLSEARRAMNEHKCYGILEIPEGFDKKIGIGEQANAVLYCEMSLMLRYRSLLISATDVMQHMGTVIQTRTIDTDMPLAETLLDGDPLPIEQVPMGVINNGFCSFVMPGVIILIIHQCFLLAVGMAGGAKSEDPKMLGYNPANHGSSTLITMAAQILCYISIMLLPIIYMIHFVPLMFDFPMAGNPFQELVFMLPLMLSAIFFAYIIQGLMWEREAIFPAWVLTSVIFLFLSGLTWPRYAMSPIWKFISDCCPTTWGVEGYIKMNSNGATLAQVLPEWRNLWILSGIYFIGAYCVQRWIVLPREGKVSTIGFKL